MKNILIIIFIMFSSLALAQEAKYELQFPPNINSFTQKNAYCYFVYEKLRLLHNQKGSDYRNNIITEEEWIDWKNNYFNPRQRAIFEIILQAREEFKKSVEYQVDLDANFRFIPN